MENRLDALATSKGPGLSIAERLNRRYASPSTRLAFEGAVSARLAAAELINAIESAREALGVSKASLANKTGRSASVVSKVLSTDSNPTLATVFELFKAIGLRVHITIDDQITQGAAKSVVIRTRVPVPKRATATRRYAVAAKRTSTSRRSKPTGRKKAAV